MTARIVIGGTGSGAGKTSVACGLIGALRQSGLTVQGFKVGPDYIDPGYHALACGRPPRNLDAFLSGPDLIAPLMRHGASSADIAVIEGVMGLFDGASGRGELASTAQVAKLLSAPVILVVDAAAMARSVAAIVHGYATFDPELQIAGVIYNRVGSDHHEQILREATAAVGIPVLGALRRDDRVKTPERHLGLVPAVEHERRTQATLAALAEVVAGAVDLAAVTRLARAAPPLQATSWSAEIEPPACHDRLPPVRIAIARGPAFSFHYSENLELLTAAGAELAPFDPLADRSLPRSAAALVLAGGFPEVFGAELSANEPLRAEIRAFAAAGLPVLAECGGLLYLTRELDGHAMCGVLPATGTMNDRLTLGYREAVAQTGTPWMTAGERVRGHEFHYSSVVQLAADLSSAWSLHARGTSRPEGIVQGSVQASYLHVHWAAFPTIAGRFVAAAAAAAGRQ